VAGAVTVARIAAPAVVPGARLPVILSAPSTMALPAVVLGPCMPGASVITAWSGSCMFAYPATAMATVRTTTCNRLRRRMNTDAGILRLRPDGDDCAGSAASWTSSGEIDARLMPARLPLGLARKRDSAGFAGTYEG
jgi:hypothetical protein